MFGDVTKPVTIRAQYRLVIADDHKLLREGVKLLLAQRPEFAVAGEADDGLELVEMLMKGPAPDIAIVDISMPRLNGIEAAREIRRTNDEIRILILTMHKDEDLLWKALMAGVDGYILKDDLATDLFPALDTVLQYKVYVSPGFAKHVKWAWLKTFIAVRGEHPTQPLSTAEIELLAALKGGANPAARKPLKTNR